MIETDELTPLLKKFQVAALGGGDPTAGCNLLAAMACTLANLAPDDGSIVHPDNSPARLGTSLLVHGSATCGQVVDEIITGLCRKQDHLIQHLQGYFTATRKWKARPHYVESHTLDSGEDKSMSYIERTQHQASAFRGDHSQTWRAVLDTPAHPYPSVPANRRRERRESWLGRVRGRGRRVVQTRAHFFGDALDVATAGGGLVHVVGGGQLAGELGVFLGCEIGTAGAGKQGDGVHDGVGFKI
jgi:hypothetical protein